MQENRRLSLFLCSQFCSVLLFVFCVKKPFSSKKKQVMVSPSQIKCITPKTLVYISINLAQPFFTSLCWSEFFTSRIIRHRQELVVITCCQVRMHKNLQTKLPELLGSDYRFPWTDGTQFLFCSPKLATSVKLLPSDTPIVVSTGPNYEFECKGAKMISRQSH